MTKRIKPMVNTAIIKSLDEADDVLAQIAARRRQLDLVALGAAEDIDAIKARAAAESEPVKQELAGLEQALTRYAEYAKGEVFAARRSVQLTFGVMGYRSSSKLKTLPKWTFERVLGALKDAGMTGYIRVKEEVDKEQMRTLAPEALARVGCRVVQEDAFFYELSDAPVNAGVASPA